ncbi:MAG: hypothetical protein Q7U89_05995 [Coriobacteriia bacterium]|nr:hypothetical protein [Coriobacteriia bacterium]
MQENIESSVTLTYDDKGRITAAGDMRYAHDSLGRRIWQGPSSDASRTAFTWSGERLITQSGPGWSARQAYDATGQRTRSVVTSDSLQTTTTLGLRGHPPHGP